ncbi:carbohydrate ABC transporter permease [Mycoplasma putrefaciens]|uniref:Glycerol transporter subunit B n=1 Tax=Mycoplasma putrefaciens Mput9231 TaxID=1292033 RepID=M9WBP3_9MOLU|nr:sugar ABC transporter permease [Mycoplasma putrefaciens]AGJ90567.1 Glycerol transporter subunit B [Mycoplasma putrefaciens Mput9231]
MKKKLASKKVSNLTQIVLLVAPLMLCILLFVLFPIIHTFIKSLRFSPNRHDLTRYDYNFGNYYGILSDSHFQHAILNSTLVLVFATTISMSLALIFSVIINSVVIKTTRKIVLSVIYSQFFISGFAIGVAFITLFGNKNYLFLLIGLNKYSFTSGDHRLAIWIYYVVFQIWRSLPFNLILLASAMSRADLKYQKVILNDKLTIIQKFKYVSMTEISKVIFAILFTNFIFASLILPSAILDNNYDLEINNAHTLTSYTIKYFGLGNSEILRYEKGYAAAFFSFSYLLLLLTLTQVLRPKMIKIMINKIKLAKQHGVEHV